MNGTLTKLAVVLIVVQDWNFKQITSFPEKNLGMLRTLLKTLH